MTQTKPLIMAVDDEPDTLRLMKRVLEPAGCEVITTTNSSQVLELAAERHPDAVLLDIKMPGKSGIEVLRDLRTHQEDIVVIMATGDADINKAIQAMRQGAFDYLLKPFNVDELVLSVEKALEKRNLVLQNREYACTLERQLTALNNLFQKHLLLRQQIEDVYSHLAEELTKVSEELHTLAKEAEAQRAQMELAPIERLKKTKEGGEADEGTPS